MDTTQRLAALTALKTACTGDAFSATCRPVSDMYRAGVLAILLSDLERVTSDVPRSEIGTVAHYTKQADWRDYTGFRCTHERTARWVRNWAARYLRGTDGDGHDLEPWTLELEGGDVLVVTDSYKVGD